MITYTTLETVSYETIYNAFVKAFVGFRIVTEATYESFCEMLMEQKYDAAISIGAFESETGELVSFVLNSILRDDTQTAYDILTGTIPEYRRQGLSRIIFEKVKGLLKQKHKVLYKTEVKKNNAPAITLYKSIGFEIQNEVVTTVKIPGGSRAVEQYEIVMRMK